jgi:TonB family protein
MPPRRYSVFMLAMTALPIATTAIAQTEQNTTPITIAPTPAPTCRLNTVGSTQTKSAKIERDASGAFWFTIFEARDGVDRNGQELNFYRDDIVLDFYLDGKKVKLPKGSYWRYSGRASFTHIRGRIAPDAKMEKALRGAGTLSVRYKKLELASVALTGLNDALPVGDGCPETAMIARSMLEQEQKFGPNRATPILREELTARCEGTATDTKTFKALRIGGSPRERKNMTLQLVGPFDGAIDANGYYWSPEDGGMQMLVDGKAYALPDDAIKGRSEGANFGQVAVIFSDGDPLFIALKKAKTVSIRAGKKEVYRYALPKKHTLFAESAACFQPARDAIIAANSTPNRALSTKGSPGYWVPQSAYPRRALRNGVEGTVGFTLTVDKYGFPEECVVTATSGDLELDGAACQNLMKRAQFNPKVDAKGELQRGTYSSRVRWVIPE